MINHRSSRIQAMAMLAAVGLTALAMTAAAKETSTARPNILFILVDDLGYGDLGSYGHPWIRTPALDRLASEGVRFTDFYSAAPVCSPARAALLTGRIPGRTGIYDWIPPGGEMHLGVDQVTVATLLRRAGYQTCMLGKWHLNGGLDSDQPQPSNHGFDYWFATTGFAMPSHRNPFNFSRNGVEAGPLEGYACDLVTDEAIHWLENVRDRARPFFQFVSFHEPHELVASPPELVKLYPHTQNRNEAVYFANVTNLDRAVGRLLAALERLELAKDTVVFFTSDNGPEMLDRHPQAARSYGSAGPLRGRKLQLWEGGIRVPGIVRWPGRAQPGTTSKVPVSGVDVLPTLCEIAGIGLPDEAPIDGASMVPAIAGRAIDRQTPLFWYHYKAWGGPRVALREGNWKLAAYWDGPEIVRTDSSTLRPGDQKLMRTAKLVRFKLYDLSRDPGEATDLATREPERLATMAATATRILGEVQRQGRDWKESWLRRW